MHNLNLYTYYDKSLAEINKEYLEAQKVRAVKKTDKKWGVKIFAAVVTSACIGLGIAYYTGAFEEKVVIAPPPPPPPPDLRTDEEKLGYTQIISFQLTDEQVVNDDLDKAVQKQKEEAIKAEKLKAEKALAEKRKKEYEAAKLREAQKKNIVFTAYANKITEKQYNSLIKAAAAQNININIVKTYTNTYSVWKVFEISNGQLIHREDFLTKSDAENYAINKNISADIKQISVNENTYDVKFTVNNPDIAREITANSSIRGELKIIQEK